MKANALLSAIQGPLSCAVSGFYTAVAMPQTPSAIQQFVTKVRAVLRGERSPRSLVQKYRIGHAANQLPAVRGDDPFGPAAAALKAAGLSGFGVSNLRKMAKFANRFSLDEAQALQSRQVSWRDVDRLRSKHITIRVGKALTSRALRSFHHHPARLGRLITEVSDPEARETSRSTATAEKRADEAIKFLAMVVLRRNAGLHIREDAHGCLLYLHRRATKLLAKINRLPSAPRPSRRKTL